MQSEVETLFRSSDPTERAVESNESWMSSGLFRDLVSA